LSLGKLKYWLKPRYTPVWLQPSIQVLCKKIENRWRKGENQGEEQCPMVTDNEKGFESQGDEAVVVK
jgi:hypothetical protein